MLRTPAGFTPLLAPRAADEILTFAFRGQDMLAREADFALPDAAALAAFPTRPDVPARAIPVGLLGARYCRALWLDRDTPPPAGYAFTGLRRLFGALDEPLLAVAARACQLAEWARTHQFCGACGAPMRPLPGERAYRCAACGFHAYPRISPAMMTLVRRGDSILLARHVSSALLRVPRYTALAGFVEAGESVEDAIHREVHEEVGLRVRDLRYFASQSWPFPHSLMIAFTAEYDGGELRLDANEIAEARWIGPGDALPEIPPSVSIASALIRAHLPRRTA